MQDVIFDHIDGIRLTPDGKNSYHTEMQVLDAWRHGLFFLYRQVRAMEQNPLADRLTWQAC